MNDPARVIVRNALAARLREVDSELRRAAATDPTVDVPPSADPEEALRRLMVRIVPAVRRSGGARNHVLEMLSQFVALRDAAGGDDLRFLDAWNSAYEALSGTRSDAEIKAKFLLQYRDVLTQQTEKLT